VGHGWPAGEENLSRVVDPFLETLSTARVRGMRAEATQISRSKYNWFVGRGATRLSQQCRLPVGGVVAPACGYRLSGLYRGTRERNTRSPNVLSPPKILARFLYRTRGFLNVGV